MRIAVIAGDGIGKDVTAEAVKVLAAVGEVFGRRLQLEHLPWSADHYLKTGETLPANGYQLLREFDAIFVGALGDPRVADNRHARDILLGTRFELDLYVNYRPVRLLDDRLSPLKDRGRKDINFVVFRENTEGVYVGVGGRFKAGTDDEVAIQEEINTYKGVHRIIRHAFEYAKANGLTKVCMADKSNAMQQGHALWQRVFKEVAASYPGITATHQYIDALAMFLVKDPGSVPGDRHQQPVRRHHHRHRRRAAGRAGHGGVGQHSPGQDVAVRAGARLGAAAGGEERRQPDRRDPVGGADARNAWARATNPRRSRPRSKRRSREGQTTADIGGVAGHARSRRLDREAN